MIIIASIAFCNHPTRQPTLESQEAVLLTLIELEIDGGDLEIMFDAFTRLQWLVFAIKLGLT